MCEDASRSLRQRAPVDLRRLAMSLDFSEAVLVLGALLAVVAAFSGWLRASILSASVLGVAAGVGLAAWTWSRWTRFRALLYAVEPGLVVTPFSDGLLRRPRAAAASMGAGGPRPDPRDADHARAPGGGAAAVFPTDGSPSASCSARCFADRPGGDLRRRDLRRVPAVVRQTLNLESGLNDGLALPLVLFFLVLAQPGGDAGEARPGAVRRGPGGARSGWRWRSSPAACYSPPGGGLAHNYEGVLCARIALVSFGLADVTVGNGLIAAYVAGLALGVADHEPPDGVQQFNENISAILQVVYVLPVRRACRRYRAGTTAPVAARLHRVRPASRAPGAVLLSCR